VRIPDAWKCKQITLLLERTKNTRVWVDKTFCGWEDTPSAPQVFDVTGTLYCPSDFKGMLAEPKKAEEWRAELADEEGKEK
jgi:hypothetical protein